MNLRDADLQDDAFDLVEKARNGELEARELQIRENTQKLLDLFDMAEYGAALKLTQWELEEEVSTVVAIARDGDASPGDRLRAIRYLNDRARQMIEMSGGLHTEEQRVEVIQEDGTKMECVRTAKRIAASSELLDMAVSGAGNERDRQRKILETYGKEPSAKSRGGLCSHSNPSGNPEMGGDHGRGHEPVRLPGPPESGPPGPGQHPGPDGRDNGVAPDVDP